MQTDSLLPKGWAAKLMYGEKGTKSFLTEGLKKTISFFPSSLSPFMSPAPIYSTDMEEDSWDESDMRLTDWKD